MRKHISFRRFRRPYTQFRINTLFPIQIRIEDSQMNAHPCGSGSATLPESITTLFKRQKADPDQNTHFLAMFWVQIWTGSGFNEYVDPDPTQEGKTDPLKTKKGRKLHAFKCLIWMET
jgi:hypothetical protein